MYHKSYPREDSLISSHHIHLKQENCFQSCSCKFSPVPAVAWKILWYIHIFTLIMKNEKQNWKKKLLHHFTCRKPVELTPVCRWVYEPYCIKALKEPSMKTALTAPLESSAALRLFTCLFGFWHLVLKNSADKIETQRFLRSCTNVTAFFLKTKFLAKPVFWQC